MSVAPEGPRGRRKARSPDSAAPPRRVRRVGYVCRMPIWRKVRRDCFAAMWQARRSRSDCLPLAVMTAIGPPSSSVPLFRGSSVVEQPTVNRLVVGSNPTRGATPYDFLHLIQ